MLLRFLFFFVVLPGFLLSEEIPGPSFLPLEGIRVYQEDLHSAIGQKGVHLIDFPELKNSFLLRQKLESYLQTSALCKENLLSIKQDILQFFMLYQPHLISVEIPEQKIEKGIVSFRVRCVKAGEVSFQGNYWLPFWHYTNQLSVKSGDLVSQREILDGAAWLNLNPFRHVDVVFSPGKAKGTTDIDFLLQDRFPLSFAVGLDNTGNSFTGQNRYYVDLRWGNVAGLGDLFTYQFMVGSRYQKFYSHFGSLQFYLPWRHLLQFYGGYGATTSKTVGFMGKGKNLQASFRYGIPFSPLYKSFKHQLTFGFDYKATNTNLFFISQEREDPVVTKTADLTQVALGYELQEVFAEVHHLFFKVDTFSSFFKMTDAQKRSIYSNIRNGARPFYFYTRLHSSYLYQLPFDLALFLQLRAQVSSVTLLPSEAFGLGGYSTVRGYSERDFLADNALVGNLEMRYVVPSVCPYYSDKLSTYLFFDLGWGRSYRKAFSQAPLKKALLTSIGPGMRYQISHYLNARLDYGFQLHKVSSSRRNFGKLHFGLAAQF